MPVETSVSGGVREELCEFPSRKCPGTVTDGNPRDAEGSTPSKCISEVLRKVGRDCYDVDLHAAARLRRQKADRRSAVCYYEILFPGGNTCNEQAALT
ncbi:hypothetical protein EVAR_62765_1 [Eumeta japonica]|uniref:Uncharacterized protein n=1 Tax=Eumeta variegata TaxID=151549 RepID=A0A4C1ZJB7_EUMVA|nr:hypothetical protein EVAR_62765_1 [Eumeta japonica]